MAKTSHLPWFTPNVGDELTSAGLALQRPVQGKGRHLILNTILQICGWYVLEEEKGTSRGQGDMESDLQSRSRTDFRQPRDK